MDIINTYITIFQEVARKYNGKFYYSPTNYPSVSVLIDDLLLTLAVTSTQYGLAVNGIALMVPVDSTANFMFKTKKLVKDLNLFSNVHLSRDKQFKDLDVYVDNEESSKLVSQLFNDYELKPTLQKLDSYHLVHLEEGCLSIRRKNKFFEDSPSYDDIDEMIEIINELRKALNYYNKKW